MSEEYRASTEKGLIMAGETQKRLLRDPNNNILPVGKDNSSPQAPTNSSNITIITQYLKLTLFVEYIAMTPTGARLHPNVVFSVGGILCWQNRYMRIRRLSNNIATV